VDGHEKDGWMDDWTVVEEMTVDSSVIQSMLSLGMKHLWTDSSKPR